MRSVIRSDALLNPNYGRSAKGPERPILIRSIYTTIKNALRNEAVHSAAQVVRMLGWIGQYFSYNPLFFCLARLEQSNDRVGA